MAKKQKIIMLSKEVYDNIKENSSLRDFSSWVEEKYVEEFMMLEAKTKELEQLCRREEEIRKNIIKIKEQEKNQTKGIRLNEKELVWLKTEGLKRIKTHTFEGVYKYFINEFGRCDLNRRQFRILIEKLQNIS